MRKYILVFFLIISCNYSIFAEPVTSTAEPVTPTAEPAKSNALIDLSDLKMYLSWMVDLRQNAGFLFGNSSYTTFGDYTSYLKGRFTWRGFEFALSTLMGTGFHAEFYDTGNHIEGMAGLGWRDFYFKFAHAGFYAALGILSDETSDARYFTIADILYAMKRFDKLYQMRYAYRIDQRLDEISIGYRNDMFSVDSKIISKGGTSFDWMSMVYYARAEVTLADFKGAVFGLYDNYSQLEESILGVSGSLKLFSMFLIYSETKYVQVYLWPYLSSVLGVRLRVTDGYSIVLENYMNYYFSKYIYALFLEGEKKDVFGWESWDANVAVLYWPGEFNNFKTFVTMRKNWNKNWLSEFRYGYESAGNHIIDASIRWYEL